MYESEYEIAGRKIVLKALTVREGAKFVFDISEDAKRADAVIALIDATLKKSGVENDFPLGSIGELSKAVLNVNGLDKNA